MKFSASSTIASSPCPESQWYTIVMAEESGDVIGDKSSDPA